MNEKGRPDRYRDFTQYVHLNIRGERKIVSRRIFNVFLWCFFVPACISALMMILVKMGILTRSVTRYIDSFVLIFPVFYSLYVLSVEVLSDLPSVIRRGGLGNSLDQAVRDCTWRTRICSEMRSLLGHDVSDWRWIASNFKVDLDALQHRARYMTALAGAVFFLLMQGIDSLGDREDASAQTLQGWFESSSNNIGQFVGLGLFLMLLYLSGSQNYHNLKRYLECAELVVLDIEGEQIKKKAE